MDATYTFAPSAHDADGDAVSFQIKNKPSWATFSTVTGRLSGTPGAAHVRTYANIIISVSDGKSSAALPAFAIDVEDKPVTQGDVTLSWAAPTENTDGSALTDLAGFVLVYGTSSSTLDRTVRFENPSVDSHVLQDLPAGTYYFAIRAYNTLGAESELSSIVSKKSGYRLPRHPDLLGDADSRLPRLPIRRTIGRKTMLDFPGVEACGQSPGSILESSYRRPLGPPPGGCARAR